MNSADRLLRVLSGFSLERPVRSIAEIAAELEVSLGTAYRYVKSLQEAGLLDSLHGEGVVLGPAIIELDRLIQLTDPLLKAASTVMASLAEQTGGTVLLCRTYRDRVICIQQESGAAAPNNVSYRRGRAMPLVRGATSKIILAHLPTRTVQRMLKEHPAEFRSAALPRDAKALQAELKAMRRERIYVTQGEVDKDVTGVAAAIHDARRVIGSLSVVLQTKLATPPLVARCRTLLAAAVAETEAAMAEIPLAQPAQPARRKTKVASHV